MTVNITNEQVYLNGVTINNRSDIAAIVQYPVRGGHLAKLDLELKIIDRLGIRYWLKNNTVSEMQLCLNEDEAHYVYPTRLYRGSIMIDQIVIDYTTQLTENIVNVLGLVKDEDNLRFKVITYYFEKASVRCSFTLNKENYIKHVSIAFK